MNMRSSCRTMADGLGSRAMINSEHCKAMTDAGVHTAVALPIGNPLLRPLKGRIDLRNHRKILEAPLPPGESGFTAQVIGTGPTVRHTAMPEVFEPLMYAARGKLFITTPYYVPDEAMQGALCGSARRGVKTTINFPARNDSFIVGGASRSYYGELLAAGVEIHEYEGGLLHTKSLTLDGKVALIGSANMDRRSFDLNYENNIFAMLEPVL